MAPVPVKPEIRFWAKVDKLGDCWLWTAGRLKDGYGAFRIFTGNNTSAHRFSWELHFGQIPAGMLVCHKCDVPLCVNPSHLFLGTPLDNTRDMMSKMRHSIGEQRPASKLTNQKVRAIRRLLAKGWRQAWLATLLGVDKTLISQISRGIIWTHVA